MKNFVFMPSLSIKSMSTGG